jgi:hypothetical protein
LKKKNSIKRIRTKLKIKRMWIEIEKKRTTLYFTWQYKEKKGGGGKIQPPTII